MVAKGPVGDPLSRYKTARTISYHQGDKITARPLMMMLKQIVANNRAGGWRKLKTP